METAHGARCGALGAYAAADRPGAAVAFGVLVLVTAFLAAALPRALDAYETKGLRQEIAGAPRPPPRWN